MQNSVLLKKQTRSPIESFKALRAKDKGQKKSPVAKVLLTSLVDAFSILVIYLLVNTGVQQPNKDLKNTLSLPKAHSVLALDKGLVIKLNNGRFEVEGHSYSASELNPVLVELSDSGDHENLIIQADQNDSVKNINIVLKATESTSFKKIQFAAFPEGSEI